MDEDSGQSCFLKDVLFRDTSFIGYLNGDLIVISSLKIQSVLRAIRQSQTCLNKKNELDF